MIALNVGCGPLGIEGEIGVDREATSAADVRGDLLALPFRDGCADRVRLDHVLEHLEQKRAVRALLECRRVLRVGGTIRVGVPDFRATCERYLETEDIGDRAIVLRNFYGTQAHSGEYHQAGWDRETLGDLLEAVGFAGVVVSDDPRNEGLCLKAEGIRA